MATIQKRGDSYRAMIRRRSFPAQIRSFPTKRAAEPWASAVEGSISTDTFVDARDAGRTTLADALDRYDHEVTPRKRAHSVKERYIIAALKVCRWQPGRLPASTALTWLA